MSWWSNLSHKNRWILVFAIIFGLLFITIISMMILGPINGNVWCTLVGCMGNGIHVNFIGNEPENYTVEVNFPSGKRKIACNYKSSANDSNVIRGDYCTEKGVFFKQIDSDPSDTPPEELVVTIIFNGNQITKTFRPEYEISYPNGENCAPMCYYATVEFDVSQ